MAGAAAGGSILGGHAQAAQARAQGKVASDAAAFREGLIRERGAEAVGRQRVGIGKSGLALEGSPLDALAQSAENVEMDALGARWEGQVARKMAASQARGALVGGYIGAAKVLAGPAMAASGMPTFNTLGWLRNQFSLGGSLGPQTAFGGPTAPRWD